MVELLNFYLKPLDGYNHYGSGYIMQDTLYSYPFVITVEPLLTDSPLCENFSIARNLRGTERTAV